MAAYPTFTIRFPTSLIDDLKAAAERDGQTLGSFVVQAVAEKLAVLRVRGLVEPLTPDEQKAIMETWAARAEPGAFERVLSKAGTSSEVRPGDELPEGWNSESGFLKDGDPPEDAERPDMPDWAKWS